MTNESKAEIVKFQLDKANKTFDEVAFLIENKFYNNAINRLYYSCFHAVSALLFFQDIKVKSHKGVIQMFGLHFIEPGIIDRETGKFFTEIFELRQDADYEYFFEAEENQVIELIEPTKKLINTIESILFSEDASYLE